MCFPELTFLFQRLFPPPMAVRVGTEDFQLTPELVVPSGSKLCQSPYLLGRDAAVWDSPSEFRPERMLDTESLNQKIRDMLFVPFGTGAHPCLGKGMSIFLINFLLVDILQRWELKFPIDAPFPKSDSRKILGTGFPTTKVPVTLIPRTSQ